MMTVQQVVEYMGCYRQNVHDMARRWNWKKERPGVYCITTNDLDEIIRIRKNNRAPRKFYCELLDQDEDHDPLRSVNQIAKLLNCSISVVRNLMNEHKWKRYGECKYYKYYVTNEMLNDIINNSNRQVEGIQGAGESLLQLDKLSSQWIINKKH